MCLQLNFEVNKPTTKVSQEKKNHKNDKKNFYVQNNSNLQYLEKV